MINSTHLTELLIKHLLNGRAVGYSRIVGDLSHSHVEVVVTDEGGEAPLEIMKPVLVVTTATTSLFVWVPIFVNSLTSSL